nr:endopeptidase [Cryptococcus depauperatus CBS 7855]
MLLSLSLTLLPLVLATAIPSNTPNYVPLQALKSRQFSDYLDERQAWLIGQSKALRIKYESLLNDEGKEMLRRDRLEEMAKRDLKGRTTGTVNLVDVSLDASYCGQVTIGSQNSQFLVIMDTGSSDLWVAGKDCRADFCLKTNTFDPSASSSFKTSNTPFKISYGSGDAEGYIGNDDVKMAGFTVTGQTFAVVTETSADILKAPLSGLMGLAFDKIASSGSKPWWQTLVESGSWDSPEMGVFMKRYRGDNSATKIEQDGGAIIFGGLDTSKYDGGLNYVSIADSDRDYWRIPLEGMSVQGNRIDVSSSFGGNPQCAIDTGTTLIGVPFATAESIYSQIPGAEALPSSILGASGYYQYPCDTNVTVKLQFGGQQYTISKADMNLGSFTTDTSMCTGAFFVQQLSSRSPVQWIVGASFLKNVYTSFRYNPAAIGFAALKDNGGSTAGNSSVPTRPNGNGNSTIIRGSGTATTVGTHTPSRSAGNSVKSEIAIRGIVLGALLGVAAIL